MALSPAILETLRCPKSKAALVYFQKGQVDDQEFLYCPRSRLRYAVVEGIPNMLIEDAEAVDEATDGELRLRAEELGLAPAG